MKLLKVSTIALGLFSLVFFSDCGSDSNPIVIMGCTCVASSNYDSDASVDDGSCLGCTDSGSDNYNACASVDDGSCIPYEPPFGGTIFIDPDIITSSDPTTFQNMSYEGQDSRTMFDRRVNAFITLNPYLFNANFDDGLTAEIQVNPEFGSEDDALPEAEKYAVVIGRLPTALRIRVETVWIHKGTEPFGGGNDNLLIHTGQGDLYIEDGILEETFVHEAAHTSLDPDHADAPAWLAAQESDPTFISYYAQENPTREDIAESFLPYLAIRYRSDRISEDLENTILKTFPNRIAYFDSLMLDMYPIE